MASSLSFSTPNRTNRHENESPRLLRNIGKSGLSRGSSQTVSRWCIMASLMSFISKNRSNRRTNEFPRLEIYRQGRAVEGRESDSFALLLFGLLDVLRLSKALESTCQRKPEVVENRRQVMAVEGPESDNFAQLFDGLVNVPTCPDNLNRLMNELPSPLRYPSKPELSRDWTRTALRCSSKVPSSPFACSIGSVVG